MIKISVVSYNNEVSGQALSAVFDAQGGTLGRSNDNHLVLPDPKRHVSRLQASISSNGERHVITNLSQANPLLLNGEELDAHKEFEIRNGDEINVGLFVLRADVISSAANDETTRPLDVAPLSVPAPVTEPLSASVLAPAIATSVPTLSEAAAESGTAGSPPPAPEFEVIPALASVNSDLSSFGFSDGPSNNADPFADLLGGLGIAPAELRIQAAENSLIPEPSAVTGGVTSWTATSLSVQPDSASTAIEPAFTSVVAPRAVVNFDDLLTDSTHGTALPQHGATMIPDDFNPFDLPSHATRNSADPLDAMSENDVTLASFEHRVAGSLLTSVADSPIDPLLHLATETGSVDPMAMFSSDTVLSARDTDIGSALTVSNHVHELNAPFLMPMGFLQPADGQLNAPIDNTAHLPPMPSIAPIPPLPTAQAGFAGPIDSVAAIGPIDFFPSVPVLPDHPAEVSALTRAIDLPILNAAELHPVIPAPTTPAFLPEQSVAQPMAAEEKQALLQAFIEGANIPEDTMISDLTPELMRSIGQILAAATQGTVELIASRALVKREVKADVTMIVVQRNNPLKFLPDGQSALMQMFGRKIPGFMEPVEAMTDAYDDLRAHQIGVVAGMRAALDEVLKRFNPQHLEKRIKERSFLDSVLPANRKAKMWDLYNELFQDIYAEAQDDFQALFGKAFLSAYEEEIKRFKQVAL